MLQTTNNIFNTHLYDLIKPQTLFAWQRVRVANMMAHSGHEWFNTVRMYNSGTICLVTCCVTFVYVLLTVWQKSLHCGLALYTVI